MAVPAVHRAKAIKTRGVKKADREAGFFFIGDPIIVGEEREYVCLWGGYHNASQYQRVFVTNTEITIGLQ